MAFWPLARGRSGHRGPVAKLVDMNVCLLAFDTSTEAMAIGVDGPLGAVGWNGAGGAQASAGLVPRVHALLAQQGLKVRDLAAIAFGAGPGAFTGLRTACSVAQGLALGAGLPVLPVDSLMIVAEDARLQGAPGTADEVGVAMDARMGELYAARYRWDGGGWAVAMAPQLCRPAVLAEAWRHDPPSVLAGSGVDLLEAASAWPHRRVEMHDRARALLRLAQRLQRSGAGVDAGAALPVYLRDKVAQTTAERQAIAAAAEAPR